MKDLFHKMTRENKCIPPEKINRKLLDTFENPVAVEWFSRPGAYEAIFYLEFTEYLARFSEEGSLTEYRINLPVDEIPEEIRNIFISKGEIMSALSIHLAGGVRYEIIYRDRDLRRHMMLIGNHLEILEEKPL